jgi:hypothetical protein
MLARRNVGGLQQNFNTMHRCSQNRYNDPAAKATGKIPCNVFKVTLCKEQRGMTLEIKIVGRPAYHHRDMALHHFIA